MNPAGQGRLVRIDLTRIRIQHVYEKKFGVGFMGRNVFLQKNDVKSSFTREGRGGISDRTL